MRTEHYGYSADAEINVRCKVQSDGGVYVLSRFGLLLWVPLAVMCFVFLGGGRAEAEEALASWYGPGFEGLPTATGEPFDPYGMTAAHKTMPLGTELLVSYGASSVEVRVNDRGPYYGGRELDLSQGAAEAVGLTEVGVDYVEYAALDQHAPVEPYPVPTDNGAAFSAPDAQYPVTDQYASFAEGTDTGGQYPETAVVEAAPEAEVMPQTEVVLEAQGGDRVCR